MSLSKWFATQRAALARRDENKASFFMRHFETQEKERNFQHDHDDSAKRAGAMRPTDPQPRLDAVMVHTKNDGTKR